MKLTQEDYEAIDRSLGWLRKIKRQAYEERKKDPLGFAKERKRIFAEGIKLRAMYKKLNQLQEKKLKRQG